MLPVDVVEEGAIVTDVDSMELRLARSVAMVSFHALPFKDVPVPVACCVSAERIDARLELPARPNEFAVRRGADAKTRGDREACAGQLPQVRALPADLG